MLDKQFILNSLIFTTIYYNNIICFKQIFTLPKEEYHKFIEHDDIDDSCSDSNIILFGWFLLSYSSKLFSFNIL